MLCLNITLISLGYFEKKINWTVYWIRKKYRFYFGWMFYFFFFYFSIPIKCFFSSATLFEWTKIIDFIRYTENTLSSTLTHTEDPVVLYYINSLSYLLTTLFDLTLKLIFPHELKCVHIDILLFLSFYCYFKIIVSNIKLNACFSINH